MNTGNITPLPLHPPVPVETKGDKNPQLLSQEQKMSQGYAQGAERRAQSVNSVAQKKDKKDYE